MPRRVRCVHSACLFCDVTRCPALARAAALGRLRGLAARRSGGYGVAVSTRRRARARVASSARARSVRL